MKEIFIVDDDRDLASLTKMALVKNGYQVSVFHDAYRVLEALKDKTPSLILMDIMLPQVSGAEAVKRIKKEERLRHVPIIFMTALVNTTEEDLEKKGIKVGETNYKTFGKPYEIDELIKMVDQTIQEGEV